MPISLIHTGSAKCCRLYGSLAFHNTFVLFSVQQRVNYGCQEKCSVLAWELPAERVLPQHDKERCSRIVSSKRSYFHKSPGFFKYITVVKIATFKPRSIPWMMFESNLRGTWFNHVSRNRAYGHVRDVFCEGRDERIQKNRNWYTRWLAKLDISEGLGVTRTCKKTDLVVTVLKETRQCTTMSESILYLV